MFASLTHLLPPIAACRPCSFYLSPKCLTTQDRCRLILPATYKASSSASSRSSTMSSSLIMDASSVSATSLSSPSSSAELASLAAASLVLVHRCLFFGLGKSSPAPSPCSLASSALCLPRLFFGRSLDIGLVVTFSSGPVLAASSWTLIRRV